MTPFARHFRNRLIQASALLLMLLFGGAAYAIFMPGMDGAPEAAQQREAVNQARFAFVSVPTPMAPDGTCDTSIVEEVVSWIESDVIVLRSTVPVGTTERLRAETGKAIVFQPEYGPAETPDHPFNDLRKVRWVILGGERGPQEVVVRRALLGFGEDADVHVSHRR